MSTIKSSWKKPAQEQAQNAGKINIREVSARSEGQVHVNGTNGAFDLKFTSGNYDWDASNYEIDRSVVLYHLRPEIINVFICWYSHC